MLNFFFRFHLLQKLALDFDIIKISEVDFDKAMENLVPSTHRIQDQSQSPLIPRLRPTSPLKEAKKNMTQVETKVCVFFSHQRPLLAFFVSGTSRRLIHFLISYGLLL